VFYCDAAHAGSPKQNTLYGSTFAFFLATLSSNSLFLVYINKLVCMLAFRPDLQVEIALHILDIAIENEDISDHALAYIELVHRIRTTVVLSDDLKNLISRDDNMRKLLQFATTDVLEFATNAEDVLEAAEFRFFLEDARNRASDGS